MTNLTTKQKKAKEYGACKCHLNQCMATPEDPCFCPCHMDGKEACFGCNQFGEIKCQFMETPNDR